MLSSVTPSQSVSTQSNLTQQHQKSYIPEKDDLWSGILKGVASSKIVPTKNVLILGEPGVGKSTLVHFLKNDPGPQQLPKFDHSEEHPASFSANPKNYAQPSNDSMARQFLGQEKIDLALGYSFVDVKDEENEAMARLGLYQLSLASPEFLPLLKFAIRADTIADSCVLILMDWTRPWEFLETLERWINVLHYLVDEICKEGIAADTNWSKGRAVVDEIKEKLEHYLQTYTEPSMVNNNNITITASTSTSSVPSAVATGSTPLLSNATTASTVDQQVMLPLSTGCLTNNLGLPITIVCCKSDAINKLEQTHDYKDEQFDYIQQSLRCICMKYGAALFYTSTLHPYTFHNLREYILHRTLSTFAKPYQFLLKAQVIERDTVLVPSGWDSWGKIKVLREGFDCDHVSEGWDADMDAVIDRQKPGNTGARGTYEEAIPNGESEIQPQYNIPTTAICEDEQSFYDRHYEKLQKSQESKPNGMSHGGGSMARPGVVGSLSQLPAAALQSMMRGGAGTASNPMSITTATSPPPASSSSLSSIASSPTENGNHSDRTSSRKKDLSLEKLLMKGINNKNGHMSPLSSPGGGNNGSMPTATGAIPNAAAMSVSPTSANPQNAPSHEVAVVVDHPLLLRRPSVGQVASPMAEAIRNWM
ncbi:dynein light intermediate chain [Mucor ambiguus]|uniref:Dynein light intermediate chain n=1 Tax=Mucor ambiguus TaxID=91626 RepID=A0A0C9LUB4_9FUNG|nr:dynein light intermediate chain [Mucor ambiguus]